MILGLEEGDFGSKNETRGGMEGGIVEKRADGLGVFSTLSIYVKYPPCLDCRFSPFSAVFSFAFVAPCRRLAYIVYLVSHCFWRRLPCYAIMFPYFSNYSHCFNNLLNSFQYYILQLSTLHHYHAFTLYIPTIHNFSLYHTLSILSPPFILSSSLLSFLYTSTTFHAFLYVLLVQSCKDIIIYLVQ